MVEVLIHPGLQWPHPGTIISQSQRVADGILIGCRLLSEGGAWGLLPALCRRVHAAASVTATGRWSVQGCFRAAHVAPSGFAAYLSLAACPEQRERCLAIRTLSFPPGVLSLCSKPEDTE